MKELRRARPLSPKPAERECRRCKTLLPLAAYKTYRAKSGNLSTDWICRKCYNASRQAWKKANRGKVNAMARAWCRANPHKHKTQKYRHKYGITMSDKLAMREQQGGCCAICKRPDTEVWGTSAELVIDHDHTTGKVRELLCRRCNSGIGYLSESAEIATAAIAYLNKHNGTRKAT